MENQPGARLKMRPKKLPRWLHMKPVPKRQRSFPAKAKKEYAAKCIFAFGGVFFSDTLVSGTAGPAGKDKMLPLQEQGETGSEQESPDEGKPADRTAMPRLWAAGRTMYDEELSALERLAGTKFFGADSSLRIHRRA